MNGYNVAAVAIIVTGMVFVALIWAAVNLSTKKNHNDTKGN